MLRNSHLQARSSAMAVVIAMSSASGAYAQSALPEIVVQAPSPLVSHPAPRSDQGDAATVEAPQSAFPGIVIADQTFSSVTVITADDIESAQARTIGDVVFTKPGVIASTFAPGASRPIIRGLDNFRVRIQENGIGAHDVSALSEDHAVAIDPLNQDRIEIIRGPATLRWGSQAIGGVVSATNNRIPDHIPLGGFYRFRSLGSHTSVDDGWQGAAMAEGGEGNFAFHVDAFKREGDDYSIPEAPGVQRNSFYETEGHALGGSYVFDQGFFGISVSRYASLYGVPGGEAAEREVKIDLERTNVTGKGEWRPLTGGIEAIRTWFGITDYAHDEIARHDPGDPPEVGSTFINKQREARTELLFRPLDTAAGRLKGAVGVQLGDRELSGSGEAGELLAPSTTEQIAGFVFQELEATPTLKFQAAGRMEQVSIDGTAGLFPPGFLPPPDEPPEDPRSLDFAPKSASAGVLKTLRGGVVASLTAQYVERAPEAPELFSKGPHEATATFEIGNPDLEIEKARTIEVGLRRARGRMRFDSSLYYTQFDGFIFKDFTGIACGEEFADCGVEDELDQVLFSQRDATFYGGEFFGEFDVARVWRGVFGIDGQFDVVKASFDDGANVPRIPPVRLGGGLFYRDGTVEARVGLLHAFDQDVIGAQETPTEGYTLLNAELNYTLPFAPDPNGDPRLTLGIVGANLLDDEVRNHASFKKEDVLLQGRSVMLRAKLRLN